MDRTIVYPGSIPLDTDLLNTNRNTMVALGALITAVLGTNSVIDGLAVRPTVPSSMSIVVAPGSITQLASVDAVGFGSLAADASSPLVKMGVNLQSTTFALTAPANSGDAISWLMEASFQEADTDPLTLPYYNATNPAQPYLGPGNSGSAQSTKRAQRVQLQCRPGAAAPLGTQSTPPVDVGWVGIAVITTTYAQTQIVAANIAAHFASPIIPFRLSALRPGFSQMAGYTSSSSFLVPLGVNRVRLRVCGGGGGGGGASNGGQSGGGAAGGFADGMFTVTSGSVLPIAVGAGGAAGSGAPTGGGSGGTSSVGALISATGGAGGTAGNAGTGGSSGSGGVGAGGAVNLTGQTGSGGGSSTFGGAGGNSVMGGGAPSGSQQGGGAAGLAPGGGGGGTAALVGVGFAGGIGGGGLVIIEY